MNLEHKCWRLTRYFETGSFEGEVKISSGEPLLWERTGAYVEELGFALPVAYAIVLDTLVQHGEEEGDEDAFVALVRRCGLPSSLEVLWLEKFLVVRFKALFHPRDCERVRLWVPSAKRVCALRLLLRKDPWMEETHEYERTIAGAY